MKKRIILLLVVLLASTFVPVSSARAGTVEELQEQIRQLLIQIEQLKAQLAQAGETPAQYCHDFQTNLRIGDSGSEVLELKTALIKDGVMPFEASTDSFDERTASYVVAFQEKYGKEVLGPYGLKRGTGFVGPTTRGKLNALFTCKIEVLSTPISPPAPLPGSLPTAPLPVDPSPAPPISGNNNPSIHAGGVPSLVPVNTLVPLTFTATDPDGDELAWIVDWGEGGVEDSCPVASQNKKTWTHEVALRWSAGGTYALKVKAHDCKGGTDSISYTIRVASSPTQLSPSITVLTPNGGETWVTGKEYIIEWMPNVAGNLKVTVDLLKGGQSYGGPILVDLLPKAQIRSATSWWVGAIKGGVGEGTDYQIRVTYEDANTGKIIVSDTSDNYFSIVNQVPTEVPAASLTVLSPNGGEEWRVGETRTITWQGATGDVSIRLLDADIPFTQTANYSYFTLKRAVNGAQGSFTWRVGEIDCPECTLQGLQIPPGKKKIRIVEGKSETLGGYDESDGSFSLLPPDPAPITVLTPKGGEKWQLGSTQFIKWEGGSSQLYSSVDAYVETLRKGRYETVGKVIVSGLGSIQWAVGEVDTIGKFVPPGEYYIRLVDKKTGAQDRTSRSFTIVPKGTVQADLKVNGQDSDVVLDTSKAVPSVLLSWTSVNAERCTIFYQNSNYGNSGFITANGQLVNADYLAFLPTAGGIDFVVPEPSANEHDISLACTSSIGTAFDRIKVSQKSKPSITVTSPNGGEQWKGGQIYNISWSATNLDNANFVIHLINYSHSSELFHPIVGRTSSLTSQRGYYSWMAPSNIKALNQQWNWGDNFKFFVAELKADGTYGTQDESDSYFSIVSSTPTDSITVLSPNGGEELVRGEEYEIRWSSTYPTTDTVSIYLVSEKCLKANCFTDAIDYSPDWPEAMVIVPEWKRLSMGSSYIWKVPALDTSVYEGSIKQNKEAPLGRYKVIVMRSYEAKSGRVYDESDGYFDIIDIVPEAPAISLDCETLEKKLNYSFGSARGKSTNTSKYNPVADLNRDGFVNIHDLSLFSTSSSNKTDGGWCKERLADSDSPFTVLSPNGGESLESGTPYTITWTSTINFSDVRIDLYRDEVYQHVLAEVPHTGSWTWNVPFSSDGSTPSGGPGYSVRIYSPGNTSAWDESDNYFTIQPEQTQLPL